ncbi:hypothetical protein A0O30_03175 [Pseudomonas sp. LLC-1]|nr:hypothetical protein A0O30_03175 [Pseudomonas sp. LLC-1]
MVKQLNGIGASYSANLMAGTNPAALVGTGDSKLFDQIMENRAGAREALGVVGDSETTIVQPVFDFGVSAFHSKVSSMLNAETKALAIEAATTGRRFFRMLRGQRVNPT